MTTKLRIDICICTFRRGHIATTIASLTHLQISSDWQVHVIVADNDDTPSAKEKVQLAAQTLPFPLTYIHAPAGNISIARNACLNASDARFLIFIDDDELASPQWLMELINTAQKEQSAAVLGPVNAQYPHGTPAWIKTGDFHSTCPVWVNGEIKTGGSGNLLLDRAAPQFVNLRFRIELGRTGGEDTVFLSTLYERGGKIAYAENALLTEPVPINRASLKWLMQRRFRSGQTHALLLLEQQGDRFSTRFKNICKATVKTCICFAMAIIMFFNVTKSVTWILRGCLHIGVVARLTGKNMLVQYG
jgi:succinoglycan biosynthesis protein ExoM